MNAASAPRLLVTGASGFIGRVLVRRALDAGHPVVASVRRPEQCDLIDQRCEPRVVGELGPETNWSEALTGVDAVIHLAARAHVLRERSASPEADFERINVAGTLHLARQAHAAGVHRFVFVSSSGVGGAVSAERPIRESDEPHPASLYARAKWAAEQALHDFAADRLEAVVVRPTLVYGPGAPGNMRRLLAAIARGWPLPLAGVNNQRSLVGVDNLCDLLLLCASHPKAAGRTFYATDGAVSSTELVRIFAEGMSRPPRLIAVPTPVVGFLFSLIGKRSLFEQLYRSLLFDSTAATATLGWQPAKSIRAGLTEAAMDFMKGSFE
jgi:nucleoside-diphosphate-sugar epimerase